MDIALKTQSADGGNMPVCAKIEAQEPLHEGHITVQATVPPSTAISASSLVGFPDVSTFLVPADVSSDKVTLVLVLYKAHCQRILDSMVAENFTEVESYITNFWGGLPDNLRVVLAHELVIDLIGVCDFILYKAILSSVVPDVLQQISLSTAQSIRNFSSAIVTWISSALEQFPESVRQRKLEVAKLFSAALKRRTSVSHLAQATRSVLQSQDSVVQMLSDWRQLHKSSIVYQSLSCCSTTDAVTASIPLYLDFMAEFENLMIQQADVESFAFWLTTVVQRTVRQDASTIGNRRYLSAVMRGFMLRWQLLASCVVRDLTLHSAESFGSHHLLSMLFEDYLLHLLEKKLFELREYELLFNIEKFAAPDDTMSSEASAVNTTCNVSAASTPTMDGGVVVLQADLSSVLKDDMPANRTLPTGITAEQLLKSCIATTGGGVGDVSVSLSAAAGSPPLASPASSSSAVVRLSAPLSVAAQIPSSAALEDAATVVAALCANESSHAHALAVMSNNTNNGTATSAAVAAQSPSSAVAVDTVALSDMQCAAAAAHMVDFSFSDVSVHAVAAETEVVLSNHL